MSDSASTKPSFPVLDQLRAWAALAVFTHHFFQQYAAHVPGDALRSLLNHLGPWGVSVFFVMSGFCIHSGSIHRPGGVSSLVPRDYALRRFFRIYPALALCVLLSCLLGHVLSANLLPPAGPLDVVAHLTLLSHFSATQRDAVNNVLWSVVAECYFYGLYGLMFRQFKGLRQTAVTTAMAIAVAALTYLASVVLLPAGPQRVLVQNLFLASWWTWCLGALVAELVHRPSTARLSPRLAQLALGLSLAVSLSIGWLPGSLGLQAQRFLLPITSAVLLYLVLVVTKPRQRGGKLVSIGLASYSLYLFHPIAIALVLQAGLGLWASAALTLPLGLMLAYLGHRWIEQPGVAWGKALGQRLRHPKAPMPKPA